MKTPALCSGLVSPGGSHSEPWVAKAVPFSLGTVDGPSPCAELRLGTQLPGTWTSLPANHCVSRLSFTSPCSAAAPEPYQGLCPQSSPL